jgi:phage-related minor tail protein
MASSAVELAVGYISIIPEMRGVAPVVRNSLGEAEGEAGRSGRNMGDQMSSGIGSTMKKAMVGVGVAAGALLAKGLSATIEKEVSVDKLNASLGSTPEGAKQYGALAGKVYAQAYGENLGEVTTAIDAVSSTLGGLDSGGAYLDDGSMERVTKKALDFAAVYGTDVTESVQTVNQLIGNGLASSADEGFDMLVSSFQSVPAAMRGELPEILNEYGTNFRGLGLDGQESFSLLISAAQKGKFVLDKTGDALKEFTIRGSDMSKASAEAYGSLGLNAEEMSKKVAAGGDGAQDAMQQTAAALLKIEDPAARANTAIALFGTPLEDLSVDQIPEFLSSLADIPNLMGQTEGAADEMGATLSDNFQTKMTAFGRGIQDNIVGVLGENALPMLGDFTTALEDNEGSMLATVAGMTGMSGALGGFEQAKGAFDSIKEGVVGVKDGFVSAKDSIVSAWDKASSAGSWVAQKAKAVGSFIATSASATVEAAKTAGVWISAQARAGAGWVAMQAKAIGSFIATAASATATAASSAGAWVAANARIAASFVASRAVLVATTVATGAMTAAQWLLNAALNANPVGLIIIAITALVAAIVLAYQNSETFRNIVQGAWEGIQAAASAAWGLLQPVFAGLVDAFKWVVNAVMGAIDFVKQYWDILIFGLGPIGIIIGAVVQVVKHFDLVKSAFSAAGDIAMWLWNNAITPAFQGIGNIISGIWNGVISPTFELIKSGVQGVGDFFSNVVSGIGTVWDGLRSILARPVNFLIETVWNNGILKAWNAVAGFLPGIDPAAPLAGIPEHATGGAINGPGGVDNVLMWGTRNEHMLTVDEVAKAGGHGAVYTIRDMIKRGVPFSWDNGKVISDLGRENVNRYGAALQQRGLGNVNPEGLFDKILPGYKDGGEILPWQKQLENGHRAAKMRDGNPYTWGFEDCSGYMSMIADAIINGGDGVRRWATSSFPGGQPFVPGLGEGFSVGVHDDPGGPGGGHTSGTLTGVGPYATTNVESGGGHGYVAYGGPAAGADSSQWVGVSPGQYHLAIGANGFFQSAGPGGGVGPSPADQSSFLTSKINDTFSAIVAPIREGIVAAIGSPPPSYLDIPPKFLDTGVDVVSKFLGEKVGSLGELLPGAWQKAKDLVGNLFDNGGIFPNNSIGMNLSGKPEAVLTNDQWQLFSAFNKTLEEVGPKFMEKMADIAPKAGLEILGLEGTLLDPGHRYYTAARDIAKTASGFQAKRAEAQPEQSQVNNDFSITVGQVVNPDPNQVARNLTDMQNRQAMRYAGRPV